MLSENKGAFLSLVRLGIGTETESVPNLTFGRVLSRLGETRTSSVPLSLLQDFNVPIDWNALEDLAARQGSSEYRERTVA